MKLLPRLYNLEEGVIRIDDYDIQKVILILCAAGGIVPQIQCSSTALCVTTLRSMPRMPLTKKSYAARLLVLMLL